MIWASVPEAERQRDQPHRDDRGGHHAGRRRQQRADEHDRIGEPAAHRPEHLADRLEQILGHAAAFEDQAHEGEKRDRQQRVVAHDAEDALRQSLQQLRLQQAEIDRNDAEEQAVGGQRERHRVAEQQKDDQRREHQRRQIGDQKSGHFTAVLSVSSRIGSRCCSSGSGIRPSRKPMRLMISDPP